MPRQSNYAPPLRNPEAPIDTASPRPHFLRRAAFLPNAPPRPSQDRARLFALVDATRAGVSQAQIGRGVARGDNAARWAAVSAGIPGSTPRSCRAAYLAAQGDSVGRTVWRAGEERALFQMQARGHGAPGARR